ncbi:hypothetical protein HPB47_015694 [Ixodes persulcatus]|uniref:Uncharacterized protein n=1 Tax=Ixodes persulcatus TaxID=34615 RepID=A0AC60QST6_IXOPE|nr:hypothetical protein HPB47_015694 [Ixodes persulcatus]
MFAPGVITFGSREKTGNESRRPCSTEDVEHGRRRSTGSRDIERPSNTCIRGTRMNIVPDPVSCPKWRSEDICLNSPECVTGLRCCQTSHVEVSEVDGAEMFASGVITFGSRENMGNECRRPCSTEDVERGRRRSTGSRDIERPSNTCIRGYIKRRSRPRTIINSLVFNHELDLLEIRVNELHDAVDYFLVCEANFTYFGDPKPLHLKSNLSAGFLSRHRHKIIRLEVSTNFVADEDPFAQENYLRSSIWKKGRHKFSNLSDDDLFMILDADEIPTREVILFLKYHDGFGEPIFLDLRWFLYGFFWENRQPVNVGGICTVGYLREVFHNDSLLVRDKRFRKMNATTGGTGTVWTPWTISGTPPTYAGWHCSWCFDAAGIQVKLISAQRDDGVRWGDFAAMRDVGYINYLRRTGSHYNRLAGTPAALTLTSSRFDEGGTSTDNLRAIVRDIVREELRKLLPAANQPVSLSIAEVVREEVQRVIQPEAPAGVAAPEEPTLTYAAVARRPPPPSQAYAAPPLRQSPAPQHDRHHNVQVQYACQEPRAPRKTDVWRTPDRRPLCFHCGEANHTYLPMPIPTTRAARVPPE